MTEKTSGIYKIINKINDHYYVGSSRDIVGRFFHHRNLLVKNKHHSPKLQAAWNKYGKDNFDFVIILSGVSVDNLLIVEQTYLDCAKNEGDSYNCAFIAGRPLSYPGQKKKRSKRNPHSLETRAKMRLSALGPNNHRYGTKLTPESRALLGEYKGKNHGMYNHTQYSFKNLQTNEVFIGTQFEFNLVHHVSRPDISALLHGKQKTAKNWIVIAVNDLPCR